MRQLTLFFFWLFGTVPTASDRLRQFHPTREKLSLFFLFLFLVLLIFNGVCFISWRFFFFGLLPAYFIACLLGLPLSFGWTIARWKRISKNKLIREASDTVHCIPSSEEVQSMHPWLEKLAMVCYTKKEKNDAKFRRRCLARNHAIIFVGFLFLTYSPHHFSRYGRDSCFKDSPSLLRSCPAFGLDCDDDPFTDKKPGRIAESLPSAFF